MSERDPDWLRSVTRRHFFRQSGLRIGSLALLGLLDDRALACEPARPEATLDPLAVRPPHFTPKAKSVIYLFMAGAPSQVDLLDPKPKLRKHDGQPIPEELVKGERFAFIKGTPRLLGSPYSFEKVGQAGVEVSELLPHFKAIVDEVAVVRSVHTTQFNHAPAQIFMNTGHQIVGRPSMGAWLTYGLGSENRDLPGFVVLVSGENDPDGGKSCWGSGFLPTVYQGVELRSAGDPVLFLTDPPASPRRPAATLSTSCARSTSVGSRRPATPRSRPASAPTSWRTACSRASPSSRTSHASPRPFTRRTAPSRARSPSPTTACSRAASSSAACDSCSSTTAAGTTTARARATTS
jgi:hypothetical protein